MTTRKARRVSSRPQADDSANSEETAGQDEPEAGWTDSGSADHRKIGELEREIKETIKKTQFAIDEARVAYRKAMQAADDIEGIQTVQNEIQVAFDENADLVDSLGNEMADHKEKLASLEGLKDRVIQAAEEVIVEKTESLAEPFQRTLDDLVSTSEETTSAVQDLTDRLDALAKDSGTTRTAVEDLIKAFTALKRSLEDQNRSGVDADEARNMVSSLELNLHQLRELVEENQAANEAALQTSREAGTDDKIAGFEKQLEDMVAELRAKQEEILAGEFEKLDAKLERQTNDLLEIQESVESVTARLDTTAGALTTRVDKQAEDLKKAAETQVAEARKARDEFATIADNVAKRMDTDIKRVSESVESLKGRLDTEVKKASEGLAARLEEFKKSAGGTESKAREETSKALADTTARVAEVETKLASVNEKLQSELKRAEESWARVTAAVDKVDGLAKRSEEAKSRVETMEQRVQMADTELLNLSTRLQESTTKSDINLEHIRLASRLAEEIHDKVRGVQAPADGVASPTYAAAASSLPDEPVDAEIPDATDLGFELNDLLQVMMKHNASDLHLKVGSPPTVRLDGELIPVGNQLLTEKDCKRLVLTSITRAQRRHLMEKKELDYAYNMAGARFRINAFLQKGTISAAFRLLRTEMPTIDDLGLPTVLKKLASYNSGLILVTGPSGSGKSTTLAALVDYINTQKKMHVITIEDPIEFVHKDKLSLITQREIGADALDFNSALKQALRQDPDVIMVGELRDTESLMAAAMAAETGHLVLSTLHTPTCVQGIERMVDLFSGDQQRQFRILLSGTLRGLVSQRLLARADEQGRVVAAEVLVVTPAISSLISEGKTSEIYPHLVQGSAEGMQTFTTSLTRLYEAGLITREEALQHADQPTEFRMAVEGRAVPVAATASAATSPESDTLMNWL